ncbi:MAG: hypothetical protein JNJ60_04560 [Rhodocyclaceae bacterium]|nr:hypothetical protein [Rhodocyclaceae bacterium]
MTLWITQEQMEARIATEDGFVTWFSEQFMQANLAEFYAAFPAEKRMAAARRARRTALHFGFFDAPSQAHFVALMWRVGANFFMFPGFREIALDRQASGPSRIDRFYTEVTPDQAADAILKADDRLLFMGPFDDDQR